MATTDSAYVSDHTLESGSRSKPSVLAPAVRRRDATIFAIPRSYAFWITTQVGISFLLLMALIEGLFMSEHFLDILRNFAGDINSSSRLVYLVFLSAAEVHFAVPITIMVAVYLVVLKCRERRELIALACTGVSSREVVLLCCIWGIVGQLISLVITGVVLPHSRFAFRSDLHAFRTESLRFGGVTDRFHPFPGMTIYKWPSSEEDRVALFVYQPQRADLDRAIVVNGVTVSESLRPNQLDLSFKDVEAVDLPHLGTRLQTDSITPAKQIACESCKGKGVVSARNYLRTLDLDELWPLEPRGRTVAEWTSSELLGLTEFPAQLADSARQVEIMDRVVRSLLCLIAPFVALLAVAVTNRRTQPFALVVACGAILVLDVCGLAIGRTMSESGLPYALGIAFMIYATIFGCSVWQVCARQTALVTPGMAKA